MSKVLEPRKKATVYITIKNAEDNKYYKSITLCECTPEEAYNKIVEVFSK